jgi:threonine/homoserine/homoserine lactone efflux protein
VDGRFLAFLVVAVALIVTPGPDTAMVTRNALRGGVRGASQTALGVSIGILTWGAASGTGLAAVLAASAAAYAAVRVVGGVALAVLGVRSIVAAARGGHAVPERRAARGCTCTAGWSRGRASTSATGCAARWTGRRAPS